MNENDDPQNTYSDNSSQEMGGDLGFQEMQKRFEDLSFRELVVRTIQGLSAPKDSGEYKFARLQVQRMIGPALAILIPFLAVIGLLCLKRDVQVRPVNQAVEIIEPETVEEIEEEPPEPPPPEMIEPMDSDVDGPTGDFNPTEVTTVMNNEPVSAKPAEMNSVAQVKSPIVMRGILGSRTPGQRGAALAKYGAGGGDASVMRALRWLKTKQNEDGSWCGGGSAYGSNKAAMTGLAILTFLAHNEVPASDTEFGPTVSKAVKYLVDSQDEKGYFASKDRENYCHPIATYALGEAYAMTKNPLVKEAAEKAAAVIIAGQNAQHSWEYRLAVTDRSDTSYAGWCAQAIKAVHTAGCEVEGLEECYQRAKKAFLCTYRGADYGGFYYARTGDNISERARLGLSGVGALCMQLLGEYSAPEVKRTMQLLDSCTFDFEKWDLAECQPWRGDRHNPSPIYYWYYITQAKFQEGGETFARWNKQFLPELMKRQVHVPATESGYVDLEDRPRELGYWDSPSRGESFNDVGRGSLDCIWFENGKQIEGKTTLSRRVMDTCLCALQLMVYYRFLPSSVAQNPALAPSSSATTSSSSGSSAVKVKVSKKKKAAL